MCFGNLMGGSSSSFNPPAIPAAPKAPAVPAPSKEADTSTLDAKTAAQKRAAAMYGVSGTNNTGTLGLIGDATVAKKKLLGE